MCIYNFLERMKDGAKCDLIGEEVYSVKKESPDEDRKYIGNVCKSEHPCNQYYRNRLCTALIRNRELT